MVKSHVSGVSRGASRPRIPRLKMGAVARGPACPTRTVRREGSPAEEEAFPCWALGLMVTSQQSWLRGSQSVPPLLAGGECYLGWDCASKVWGAAPGVVVFCGIGWCDWCCCVPRWCGAEAGGGGCRGGLLVCCCVLLLSFPVFSLPPFVGGLSAALVVFLTSCCGLFVGGWRGVPLGVTLRENAPSWSLLWLWSWVSGSMPRLGTLLKVVLSQFVANSLAAMSSCSGRVAPEGIAALRGGRVPPLPPPVGPFPGRNSGAVGGFCGL